MSTDNVVKLKRKPRPLRKTYSTTEPYVVERQDQEDGSIHYEIWDHRPDSYRRVCTVCEDYNDDSEDGAPDRGRAQHDAGQVARGLNLLVQYGMEKLPPIQEPD